MQILQISASEQVDESGDGVLTFEEVCEWMQKKELWNPEKAGEVYTPPDLSAEVHSLDHSSAEVGNRRAMAALGILEESTVRLVNLPETFRKARLRLPCFQTVGADTLLLCHANRCTICQ